MDLKPLGGLTVLVNLIDPNVSIIDYNCTHIGTYVCNVYACMYNNNYYYVNILCTPH